MKIGYTIAAYIGKREHVHDKCINDPLFYIKIHLDKIQKSIIKLDKVYIICTFSSDVDKEAILEELKNITKNFKNIIISDRPNLGGSYCSWHLALTMDLGYCDYILLLEDDYTLYDENSISYLLDYFNEDSDILYLAQLWSKHLYEKDGLNIPEHAAISNGIINNKLYYKIKTEKDIDFNLQYGDGYRSMYINQAAFLENYRKEGYKLKHWADKDSSIYKGDKTLLIEYGNENGRKILIPIMEKFF